MGEGSGAVKAIHKGIVRTGDMRDALVLSAMGTLAWTLPARAWPGLCHTIGLLAHALRGPTPALARAFAALGIDARERAAIEKALVATSYEATMHTLRAHRPMSALPPTPLIGTDHLERALARGHGAVLWMGSFAGSDLHTKKALGEHGYRVVHLSTFDHGFSPTWLGVRLLNPVRTRIEDRYLAERIRLTPGASLGPVRALKQRLAEGRIVSIRAVGIGRRVHALPFLGGALRLASGAAHLGMAVGAPILPVFTVPAAGSRFAVVIGTPLQVDADGDSVERALAQAFADRLMACVRRHPGRWRGWLERDIWSPEPPPASPRIAAGVPLDAAPA